MNGDLTDPANIIAAVIKQNENSLLRTEHDIIKGWYSFESIQPAISGFININQVIKTKEISLWEIVSCVMDSQGLFNCYYQRKCETKKYVCFKVNLKCISRYCNAQNCLNK